jgi:hypothetical protein
MSLNYEIIIQENNELKEKINSLEIELEETKEHLKKYTAPSNMKKYYENHKEEIKNKVKEYKNKTNYYENLSVEKKKEYARRAYLNKKAKMNKTNEIKENETI